MDERDPHDTGPADSDLRFQMHEGLPVFPLTPDSIAESRFHVIETGDMKRDVDVAELIKRMWLEPEAEFYCYIQHQSPQPADAALIAARDRGDILMDESERRYYRHPENARDYVRILPSASGYGSDWQRGVVEKGPEFWRVTLKLSARKRDELNASRGRGRERMISLGLNLVAGLIMFVLGVVLGPWLTRILGITQ